MCPKYNINTNFLTADKILISPYVIIMVGVPRSGKTTIVNNLYHTLKCSIICKDDIRRYLGVRYSEDLEDKVKEIYWGMIGSMLLRGQNIILDECHHIQKKRIEIIEFIRRHGGRPYICEIERVPYSELKRRCKKTDFPLEVLERFLESYEKPDYNIEAPRYKEGIVG